MCSMDLLMPVNDVAPDKTLHRCLADNGCLKPPWQGIWHPIRLSLSFAWSSIFCMTVACAAQSPSSVALETPSLASVTENFEQSVVQHLTVPLATVTEYATMLKVALKQGAIADGEPAFIVLVDRNPNIQALFVFLGTNEGGWSLVGATAISTGLPGTYEHFKTPLGVFDHSRENPDFRAEGTKNKFGVRGYGNKGGRIYDFGWVKAPRGWGDGHMGELRLQMHSTDRDLLEKRLGTAQSEGCVRMPAELNEFLDLHAILDQDYERVIEAGTHPWVLRKDRQPTPWAGRYLVVIESDNLVRPPWAAIDRKWK
jgi:lipoprotein-anchoring transpeptidase ErfK/SrfK